MVHITLSNKAIIHNQPIAMLRINYCFKIGIVIISENKGKRLVYPRLFASFYLIGEWVKVNPFCFFALGINREKKNWE